MTRLVFIVLALACTLQASAADPSWRDSYASALEIVRAGAQSQRRIDAMSRERDDLHTTSADTRLQQDFANRRLAELESEQFRRAAEIVELEDRLRAGELTRLELVPLLKDMLDALDTFVANDLPFDIERRRKRIGEARNNLSSHSAPLEQKLLNVYELYRAEIDAGQRVATARGRRIRVQDAERAVDLLRAGRVGLYAITPDRQWVGAWDRETETWQTLPAHYRESIVAAYTMHASGTYTEPLALPVAMP